MDQSPMDALSSRLDMIYWLRQTVEDLTKETTQLIGQESATVMDLTVDERLANMTKNRRAIIDHLADGHYLPMSPGQQFAEAARYVGRGLDPAKTAEGLADTLRRPTDLPAWIQRLSQAQDGYPVELLVPKVQQGGDNKMEKTPEKEPVKSRGLLEDIVQASKGRVRVIDMRNPVTKDPEPPKVPQR